MVNAEEKLNQIYDHTSGYCHLCHKKLSLKNYGQFGARGAWEVEHSTPLRKGGTDHLNNLYPACISCNREKGIRNTRTARNHKGKRCAPLSIEKRRKAKVNNALIGGFLGGAVGSIFGPPGTIIGSVVGGHLGYQKNPDKTIG